MFSDIADADDFDSWLSRNQEQRTKKAPFAVKPQPAAESTENETAKAPNDESLKTGIGTQSISSLFVLRVLTMIPLFKAQKIQSNKKHQFTKLLLQNLMRSEKKMEKQDGLQRTLRLPNESFTVVQAHKT